VGFLGLSPNAWLQSGNWRNSVSCFLGYGYSRELVCE
jgi:hypothetical protein